MKKNNYSLEEIVILFRDYVDFQDPIQIDNDTVFLYFNGECIYEQSPQDALLAAFKLLGLEAEYV